MADLQQANRFIRINTPLGSDVLVPRLFEGTDSISHLYEYRVELASESGSISATDIVGKRATVSILQSDQSTQRYFDGFVSHFAKLPRRPPRHVFFEYELRIVPWTWFLTRTTDCRIFQQKTVQQVMEQIFSDLSFSDYQFKLSGTHNAWDYCVQYRETAFNFISRLMEKEGMYYFFQHSNGKHVMVIGDSSTVPQNCDYQSTVGMDPTIGGVHDEDSVYTWERHYQYRSGKWTQTDYNFETPTTSLLANETTVLSIDQATNYEFFDYPGEYLTKGDGEPLTKLRMEEEEAGYDTAQGESGCRSFTSGYKFTLKNHEQSDQNATYVLHSVSHRGVQASLFGGVTEGLDSYSNSFECFPATVQYRPQRMTPRAIVHGTQTAVVVGPSGEEIFTDEYGRVKVQFFWDRKGQKDQNSSCWIRVSQPWAGKSWGGIWIPRIGQEVVVDFLEGDPDRPLIVGRVYNEQQTVPYALPDNSTQSGFKSRSSPNGGSNDYNEFRYEDKNGSEEVYLQAQKDLNILVKNNQSRTVNVDETVTIGGNRTETVTKNETGTVKQNRSWTVTQNDTLTVNQDQTINVTGSISITANQQITITCGANSITLGPSGISIQGSPIVEIN